MKAIRAGSLRQRITFQQRAATVDDYGQESETWNTILAAEPASVQAVTATEFVRSGATAMVGSYKIMVRHRAELSDMHELAAMRILHDGRIFNIVSAIDMEERKNVIEILATDGGHDGQ